MNPALHPDSLADRRRLHRPVGQESEDPFDNRRIAARELQGESPRSFQGHARIAPATFSPLAAICLADGTNGVGVIETSGSFTRAPGTGKGELCWKRHAAMPAGYGLLGGFAAKGGAFTVDLGGDARKLEVGSAYLPEGAVIQLQSQYADGALDFQNGFELGGKTQKVSIWSGKTATISGNVSDAVGGGKLDVTGSLALAGTLEVGANNLAGDDLVTVNGTLDLTNAKVDLNGLTSEQLAEAERDGIRLASATTVVGQPAVVGTCAGKWGCRVRAGVLTVEKIKGIIIVIK